ncbi:uncharacterized protein LOC134798111 [Cydia splendana]|uniref:uncharacterized protein LOC134798111 n=1 Tax=Cydia splendana TaxID=1100963 RepID=UPI00212BDA21
MEWIHTKPFLNEKLPLQQRQALDSLIEVLIEPRRLERELFFSLLLILMRENDFLQIKAPNECAIDISDYILSTRKKNTDIFEATFVLNGYQDLPIKIFATPLPNALLLNSIIPDTGHSYAVCLEPRSFLDISELGIPYSIKNFSGLKRTVKEITDPIKSCILNQYNTKRGTLLSLPKAVILEILLKLPIKDVLNLSESSKIMNCIVKEDRVWSRLYNRDFSEAHKFEGWSWLDQYREIYVSGRKKSNIVQDFRPWDYEDYLRCANIDKLEIIL